MTEEQKQALIEWLKPQIDELQNVCDEIPFGLDSDSAMHLNTMRVALAALAAQPIGRVDRGELSDNNEYPNARVVCLHDQADWENFQDGTELYLRPAPAADLTELVPDVFPRDADFDDDSLFDIGVEHGWSACRAAILRNIEGSK